MTNPVDIIEDAIICESVSLDNEIKDNGNARYGYRYVDLSGAVTLSFSGSKSEDRANSSGRRVGGGRRLALAT